MKIIIFIIHVFITLVLIFVTDSDSRRLMSLIYLTQYLLFVIYHLKFNKNITYILLKPSFLILTYSCIYFGIGNLFLYNQLGFNFHLTSLYNNVENFSIINIFLIVCNYIVFSISALKSNSIIELNKTIFRAKFITKNKFIYSIMIFVFFSGFDLDLSFIGGGGSFSYIPKVVASIFIVLYVAQNYKRTRFIYYLPLILLFLISSYDSKREIIFIILMILVIDLIINPINLKINFKTIFIIFVLFSSIFLIITASSIRRGYGDYRTSDMIESIKYVPDYIKSDYFLDAIGDNFEFTMVYGNVLYASELYIKGEQKTLFGETFFKALFIPIPRSWFDYKPRSFLEIYSPIVNGTSYNQVSSPVHFYVELLWNFSIFFFVGLFLIVYIFDRVYLKIVNSLKNSNTDSKVIFFIVIYTIFMQFIRGSGIELLFIYLLLSIPFIIILSHNTKIFKFSK